MEIRRSATGLDIPTHGDIDEVPTPAAARPCPWCGRVEGLVAHYLMTPKPEQAARVFILCGAEGKQGCGARGPWRLNPIVLKNPDDQREVAAYFENMARVSWGDWNKPQGER